MEFIGLSPMGFNGIPAMDRARMKSFPLRRSRDECSEERHPSERHPYESV
jgi:hypothetical protein